MATSRSWLGDTLRTSDLFLLTTSLGLFTGMVEGAGLFWLQKTRWAGSTIDEFLVPHRILYVSVLTDLVLFLAVGFLVAGICRWARVVSPDRPILFVLTYMLVFDCLCLALDQVMAPGYIAILSAGIVAALLRRLWPRRERLLHVARRCLPALAVTVVLLICANQLRMVHEAQAAASGFPLAARSAPNVLIVVMDTVRADHLSALGYSRPTTPNLDRLASQGVLFENAFSTSSWTLPAHASLLTGRFPFEHGAEVTSYDGRYPTLPEAFEERGYRTGAFSANTYYFARENGFGRGFQSFDGAFDSIADELIRTMYGRLIVALYEQTTHADLPGRKSADLINAHFLGWLQEDSARPFFAVLNYFDAHAPYLPPAPYRARFAKRPDPGGILNPWGDRDVLDRPEDARGEIAAYDGGIAYIDAQIGLLMDALRQRGLAQNTLLVVVSDHGEYFGEHGLYMHLNALFLEGIHVPLLLDWPGHVPAGVRISDPVSIASLPATVLELIPGRAPVQFPGPSLAPLWSKPSASEGGPLILSEVVEHIPGPDGGPSPRMESLISPRWHFMAKRGEDPRLFEWRTDPHEADNLAQTEEGRRVVGRMMGCLQGQLSHFRESECGLSIDQTHAATQSPSSVTAGH